MPALLPVQVGEYPYRKSLLELEENSCRWPVGEPRQKGFFFCGRPEADLAHGRPYCPACAGGTNRVQATGFYGGQ